MGKRGPKRQRHDAACPNEECYGKVNGENSIGHGAYKGGQRYKCNACGRTFTERTNTPLAGLRTPTYIVIMAIVMYMPGLSVARIAIVVGKQVFIAFYVGSRDRISAEKLFEMTVARIRGIPLLTTTDGNETYPGMVKKFLKAVPVHPAPENTGGGKDQRGAGCTYHTVSRLLQLHPPSYEPDNG